MSDSGVQPEPGPGTVALVTGASSGIGAATARQLAARGVTVALVARRADRLDEVLADCRTTAPASRAWPTDLADPERAAALARSIWAEYGAIDVVVNNAGIPMRRPAERLTMEEVRRPMTVNYLSPVAITLALLPGMLERRSGVIVNVSSLGGRLGIATEAAYCASKFALAGFSESLAADLAGTGVSVRLVLPGAIDTEIWEQPGNDAPLYTGPLVPADEVAAGIVACIASPSFEHYLPDLKAVVEMKTADFDGFVAGMLAMAEGRLDDDAVARTTNPGKGETTGGNTMSNTTMGNATTSKEH
jgi:short-subunit dehydrogenase